MRRLARHLFTALSLLPYAVVVAVCMPFVVLRGPDFWRRAAQLRRFMRGEEKRHRLVFGLCANCGYDLRASPGRCPECGAEAPRAGHSAGSTG